MDRKQDSKSKQQGKAAAEPVVETVSNETAESVSPPSLNMTSHSENSNSEEKFEQDFSSEEKEGIDLYDEAPPIPPIIKKRSRIAADGALSERNLIPYQLKLPFTTKIDQEQEEISEKYTLDKKPKS